MNHSGGQPLLKDPCKQLVLFNDDLDSTGDDLESKDEVSLKDQNHNGKSENEDTHVYFSSKKS